MWFIYISDKYTSAFGVGGGGQFAYYHDEDESSFHLVDTTKVQRPMFQRARFRPNQRALRGRGAQRQQPGGGGMKELKSNKGKGRFQRGGGRGRYDQNKQMKNREASVIVKSDWKSIEEMDFPRLSKLSLPNVKDPEDL